MISASLRASETESTAPLTVAESSGYRATSRSAEVVTFINTIAGDAEHVQTIEFGRTVEGRPLQCVVVAQPSLRSPTQLTDDQRAVVLVLGNIHSGECAGKEAMLMLLRELSQQPEHPWLKNLVLLFIPNYNADANDMVSRDNRPGQIGPEQGMGRRANAQGLDLNRDYVKLDSPECRALVGLVNKWDPHAFIDMHTTNGSWHRYALTFDIPHNPASPAAIRTYMRQQMMPAISQELEQKKGIATFYYGNFDREHTRWNSFGDQPRFGTEYMGMRGRLSILAEAYAYISYEDRIVASREFLRHCLDYMAPRTGEIRQLLSDVRQRATAHQQQVPADEQVAIQSSVLPLENKVVVRGYEPASQPRERRVRPTNPKDYTVDFYTRYVPAKTVQRPVAYLVPADQVQVIKRLRDHGIVCELVTAEMSRAVRTYKITKLTRRQRAYQNRHMLQMEVEPHTQSQSIAKDSFIVRTNQPLSNLIVYFLEPASTDGLAAWNVFQPELAEGDEYPIRRLEAN